MSLEFGVWNLEFGIWSLEFGIWSLEFGVWKTDTWVQITGIPFPFTTPGLSPRRKTSTTFGPRKQAIVELVLLLMKLHFR